MKTNRHTTPAAAAITALVLAVLLILCTAVTAFAGSKDSLNTRSDSQEPGTTQDRDSFHTKDDPVQEDRQTHNNIVPAEDAACRIIRLYDESTDLTLGRACIPSDFTAQYQFLSSLSETGECSINCPYQVVLDAVNSTGTSEFFYRSEMLYLYPPDPEIYFHEGLRYGVAEHAMIGYPTMPMLFPRAADEYADYIMENMNFGGKVYYDGTVFATDEDDPFLEEQSQTLFQKLNTANPLSFLFNVECTGVRTTCTESAYYVDIPGDPLAVKIITSTSMLHYYAQDNTTGASCDYGITYIPYFYMCIAPASEKEEIFARFDVFAANTRTTDEFAYLNARQSQALFEIVMQGWTLISEQKLFENLGTGYGSYYEDQFSDYIFDQNEYTTSDGRSFKVPTSYDYVYETYDGEIYVTNSAKQPQGSTRLYAR